MQWLKILGHVICVYETGLWYPGPESSHWFAPLCRGLCLPSLWKNLKLHYIFGIIILLFSNLAWQSLFCRKLSSSQLEEALWLSAHSSSHESFPLSREISMQVRYDFLVEARRAMDGKRGTTQGISEVSCRQGVSFWVTFQFIRYTQIGKILMPFYRRRCKLLHFYWDVIVI